MIEIKKRPAAQDSPFNKSIANLWAGFLGPQHHYGRWVSCFTVCLLRQLLIVRYNQIGPENPSILPPSHLLNAKTATLGAKQVCFI